MRRLASLLAATGLLISIAAAPVAAGGPPSLSFYIDGARYRTVGTPTDFSNTGAPDSIVRPDLRARQRPDQRRRGQAGRHRLQRRPLDGSADHVEHDARSS